MYTESGYLNKWVRGAQGKRFKMRAVSKKEEYLGEADTRAGIRQKYLSSLFLQKHAIQREKNPSGTQVTAAQVMGYEIALGGFFGLIVVFTVVTAQDDAVLLLLMKIEFHVKVLQQVQVHNKLHFFCGMDVFAVVQEHVGLLAVGERLEQRWCQHLNSFRLSM